MKRNGTYCAMFQSFAWLESSQELGRFARFRLNRHCARCPACAEYREAIPALERTARQALDIGNAGSDAVRHLMYKLPPPAPHPQSSRPAGGALPLWKPAFSGLALLLLLAGGLYIHDRSARSQIAGRPERPVEWTDLDLWHLEIEMLNESLHALQRDIRVLLETDSEDPVEDLDDLARELIRLEEALG